jgi:hypothetical protein
MTPSDRLTAAEAERRVNSTHYCGGTPEQRRFAIRRWTDALRREWYQQRATENRERAEAVR